MLLKLATSVVSSSRKLWYDKHVEVLLLRHDMEGKYTVQEAAAKANLSKDDFIKEAKRLGQL